MKVCSNKSRDLVKNYPTTKHLKKFLLNGFQ